MAEPVLRNAHIVSLDARAIKASEIDGSKNFSPNGFDGREICAIARYAGMSDNVSVFGIYEMREYGTILSINITDYLVFHRRI